MSIADKLMNKNKNIKTDFTTTYMPKVEKDYEGSDRYWHNGTYKNVKCLYERAKSNKLIKDKDKDDYLTTKFINENKKWYTGGIIGNLLIDVMIAETFNIISAN